MLNRFVTAIHNRSLMPVCSWARYLSQSENGIRHFKPWMSSLKDAGEGHSLRHDRPWLTFDGIDWLERMLTPDSLVFEWGSGASTLFLSRRVKQVVSVEHDPKWYSAVKTRLALEKTRNIEYLLRPGQQAPAGRIGVPGNYRSNDPRQSEKQFESYCRAIDAYSSTRFDVILVDGRARNSCMAHALARTKPGGYIVLDNSERDEYRTGLELFKNASIQHFWGPGPYNPAFWRTTIISV